MKIIDRLKIASRFFVKGWQGPSAGDETAWQGTNYWGSFGDVALTDPASQVNENKGWVYICIAQNAKAVSSVPLRLYTTKGKLKQWKYTKTHSINRAKLEHLQANPGLGKWLTKDVEVEEIESHPFLDMMKEVSPVDNQADLWMLTETYMGLTGNCYWYIRENKLDVPFQLWFLDPRNMKVVPGKGFDDFIKGYVYRQGTDQVPFDPDEILHHRYPNPKSRFVGLSPLEGIASAVNINNQMANYQTAVFKNMARPDTALFVDGTLSDVAFERLKKQWYQKYGGTENAGKMAIIDGAGKKNLETFSMKPSELNFPQGKKATREEIADGYGIPMALLSPDDSNRAVAYTAYAQYMRDTIHPKLILYEQKLNEQLLPWYDENIFVAFDNPVPADREQRRKDLEAHLKTGFSYINEERQEEQLEEVEWGERPIMPMTMQPIALPGEEPEEPEKPPEEVPEESEEELAMRMAKEIYRRM